jgi:hypothetical protein
MPSHATSQNPADASSGDPLCSARVRRTRTGSFQDGASPTPLPPLGVAAATLASASRPDARLRSRFSVSAASSAVFPRASSRTRAAARDEGARATRRRRAAPSSRVFAAPLRPRGSSLARRPRRSDAMTGFRLGSGRDPRGARPHQTPPPPTPTLTPPPSTAVPKDFQDQEDPGQEAEAEPPHPPVDPHAHGQHHQVRLEPPGRGTQERPLSSLWTLRAFFRVRGPRPGGGSPHVHRSPARIAPRSLPTRTVALTLPPPSSFRYNAKRRHWRRTKLGL